VLHDATTQRFVGVARGFVCRDRPTVEIFSLETLILRRRGPEREVSNARCEGQYLPWLWQECSVQMRDTLETVRTRDSSHMRTQGDSYARAKRRAHNRRVLEWMVHTRGGYQVVE
jgi:hypothetical protein